MTDLIETLVLFKDKANTHPRIASLIKGWEPTIVVEATDSGTKRYLPVRACRIASVDTGDDTEDGAPAGHVVHLRAAEAVLAAVFDGRSNPADAFLEGDLEIFASDKDQVKLDAISLVLWGA
ncbi:hypothetical protein [Ramlibacter sp.]|uniref:hypothetical protein n=1 Tax=Ramlibacter sp. TaxID=1917967 RepID=UPI001812361F|nr:hypothetical protein [Ramlibacter sp.]MBA2676734.1 hypothetical protein [Ramlibacter sp.]